MKNPFKRSKNTSLVLAAAALGAVTTAAWVEIKARRAERKAKASRSGDDREEEEEHPAR